MNSTIRIVAARLAGWIDSYVSAGAVVRALQDGRRPDPDHLRQLGIDPQAYLGIGHG